ncbi:terminase TerL endonuclease subunit [Streptosporangium soli]|nr:terminase large subunit [Streptosporangium sp. KLBMP 9127]
MTRRKTSSPVDHDKRWRPRDRRGPACGYTFRGTSCERRGAHYCKPRADRVVAFYTELLVHTKGAHARNKFTLAFWQEHEIVRPLFGEVVYSGEWGCYVRRYRIATICMGRKNGKSGLLSGAALYLLVGDDEESAEVYGAAADTKQAGKVFEPSLRMVQLSPVLNKRLKHLKNNRRLVDERTASYYEVIPADAMGELGHNPHGFILDEVLSQPDDSLWNTMRTAAGARIQPLFLCITTETNQPVSFGASFIDEADRVMEDPKRAPHQFAYIRKLPRTEEELDRLRRLFPGHPDLPVSTDAFDERNWRWPNPGLDDFLSRDALRQEALEARNERSKENAFRQFRANQRVQTATRYISLDLWDGCAGEVAPNPEWILPKIEGRKAWGGLDLSSKLDMTSWCLHFDNGWTWWRFWAPESVVSTLDDHTGGQFSQWVSDGWVTLTDGDTIDYDVIYDAIEEDDDRFRIVDVTYDKWCGEPVRQAIEKRTKIAMVESGTTYSQMTDPMKELMRLLKAADGSFMHGGNPVARWMADALQAKSPADDPDRVRPVKPDRDRQASRIDGMITLLYGIDGRRRGEPAPSIYERRGLSAL